MLLKKVITTLTGLIIYFFGLYISDLFWYADGSTDGDWLIMGIITLILCGSGLYFTVDFLENKYPSVAILPFVGALLTVGFVWYYHYFKKEDLIKENGSQTLGIVTSQGSMRRGKSTKQEIRYWYVVGGKTFKKYDRAYIFDNEIKGGDTLIIRFWNRNPHFHTYSLRKSN